MINDPGLMALLQARRNYSTRAPAAPNIGTDPMEPPDPVVTPPPAAVPAPPPEAKSLARAQRMRAYMQANGMQPMTYGANNRRTGNLPIGSGLPGGMQSELAGTGDVGRPPEQPRPRGFGGI